MKKVQNTQLTDSELEQLHQAGQQMLDVFVKICEEHGLCYYVIAGTLLGAVRHNGPIPWDNDVDVCMPRKDCDKFIETVLAESGGVFSVRCFKNDPTFPTTIVKFFKRGTTATLRSYKERNSDFHELWLDIFPLDDSPGPSDARFRLHGKRILMAKRLTANKSSITTAGFSWRGKLVHALLRPFSYERMRARLERLIRTDYGEACEYYVSWTSHYPFLKQTMPKAWYEPATTVLYGGKHYRAPGQWDKVLTQLYGDYMTPPPENEREKPMPLEIDL